VLSITLAPMAGRVATFGSLRGLTVDATNSAVPAAHINVHGLDDNTDHEVISGDEGVFEVENLKPGRYRVTGRVQGFANAVVPELKLAANVRQNGALRDACPSSEGIEELKITTITRGSPRLAM
jgi:Carboxypeptidase regulatory-like domain